MNKAFFQMMQIQTLENISIEKILQVFNESFADYLVPLKLNKEQLESKIKNEGIMMELSAGVFENDLPVAFILHGYDVVNNQRILYNSGTGVLPSYRGKQLTRYMYELLIPILQQREISKIQLEVITENLPAFKAYETIGFKKTRTLNCYKGSLGSSVQESSLAVLPLESYDWETMRRSWDWHPTWQNSISAIERSKKRTVSFGIIEKNRKLVGYIIFNTVGKRVRHFAVHKDHRHQGIGSQLFEHLATNFAREFSIINVDSAAGGTNLFLTGLGLRIFIRQYEMELNLKSSW